MKTILIIEDDIVLRETTAEILELENLLLQTTTRLLIFTTHQLF